MFSNDKVLNVCKVIVVLLILVFCLIPYFRSKNLDTLENNNVSNYEDSNNDVNNIDDSNNNVDNSKDNNNNNEDDVIREDDTEKNDDAKEDDESSIQDVEVDDSDKNEEQDDDSTLDEDNLITDKKIVLEDRMVGDSCAQAIEYFYEDNEYRYYFTCIKSNSMYVIVNGVEYKLVDALNNGIVTMKELENNGYKFLKESKNVQIR